MYRAGVTCSNCHEPHSRKLRADGPTRSVGSATCRVRSRRRPIISRRRASPAATCRLPHAGQDLHGLVHPRDDHGLRVPRPQSRHSRPVRRTPAPPVTPARTPPGRSPHRRVARIEAPPRAGVGQTPAADRKGGPGAGAALAAWPTIRPPRRSARATAVAGLERHLDQPVFTAIQRGLGDVDPMVVWPPWGPLAGLEPQLAWAGGPAAGAGPGRGDPPGGRPRAGASPETVGLPAAQRAARSSRLRRSNTKRPQKQLLDRPEGLLTLGKFYRDRGRRPTADANPRHDPAPAHLGSSRSATPTSPTPAAPAGSRRRRRAHPAAGAGDSTGECRAGRMRAAFLIRQKRYADAVMVLGKAAQPCSRQPPLRPRRRGGAAGRPASRPKRWRCWSRSHQAASGRRRTSSWRWPAAACSRATAKGPALHPGPRPGGAGRSERAPAAAGARHRGTLSLHFSCRTGRAGRRGAAGGRDRCAGAAGAGRSRAGRAPCKR